MIRFVEAPSKTPAPEMMPRRQSEADRAEPQTAERTTKKSSATRKKVA